MSHVPVARVATLALLLASCTSPGPSGDDDDATTPTGDTSVIPTGDTSGGRPVALEATATVTSISQATVSVDLSAPASVAAACEATDDPAEVHLLEADGTDHVDLRFAGLLSATDYDCKVAPTSAPGAAVEVSFRTADPPPWLPSADVTGDEAETMTGAYTVMNVRNECSGARSNSITVLDPQGRNRFRYDLPDGTNIGIEVRPDGPDRFLWGGGEDPAGAPAVVDVRDGQTWRLAFPGSDAVTFHHDGHRVADGRVLSTEEDDSDGWLAFQLRLSEDDGSTSWLWDVRSAVATGWLPGGSADHTDPHHLNWADVLDSGDGPIAYGSLCFSKLVIAVDVTTSEPLWRFGAGGDFSLVDEQGRSLPDDEYPQCQHGASMDGTHLLLFDNGLDREASRAVEYTLDTRAMKATKTWEWRDDGFFEPYHGSTDWLTPDHERVLVAESANDCGPSARPSQVAEVDRATGAVVHRLTLHDGWLYRAHRADGCALFANARYCPAVADRLKELAPVLGR